MPSTKLRLEYLVPQRPGWRSGTQPARVRLFKERPAYRQCWPRACVPGGFSSNITVGRQHISSRDDQIAKTYRRDAVRHREQQGLCACSSRCVVPGRRPASAGLRAVFGACLHGRQTEDPAPRQSLLVSGFRSCNAMRPRMTRLKSSTC